MKDVKNVHAAALLAHGNNDFNVMTKNAAQFYDALKAQNVPHMFYFHQGGHGGAPPDVLINLLVHASTSTASTTASRTCRSPGSCARRRLPAAPDDGHRRPVEHGDAHRRRHEPVPVGFTLTVPQTNANGTITNTTRLITDIPDATHLMLASAVATAAGQKVADGAVVSLVCGTANPTPYAEWPDPATRRRHAARSRRARPARGGLTLRRRRRRRRRR